MYNKPLIFFLLALVCSGFKYTGYNLILYPDTFVRHNFLTFNFGIMKTVRRDEDSFVRPSPDLGTVNSLEGDSGKGLKNLHSINQFKVRPSSQAAQLDETAIVKSIMEQSEQSSDDLLVRKLEKKLESCSDFYSKKLATHKLELELPAKCQNEVSIKIYFRNLNPLEYKKNKSSPMAAGVMVKLRRDVAVMSFMYPNQPEKSRKIETIIDRFSARIRSFQNDVSKMTKVKGLVTDSIKKHNEAKPAASDMDNLKQNYYQKQLLHKELMEVMRKKAQQKEEAERKANQDRVADVHQEGIVTFEQQISPSDIVQNNIDKRREGTLVFVIIDSHRTLGA